MFTTTHSASPEAIQGHDANDYCSNNCPSGVRDVMTMFPMLPTSLVFSSTRSVSLRTSSSTATTSTVSPSRASVTLRLPSSPAETVSPTNKHHQHDHATNNLTGKQKITDQIAQLKYKEPNSPKIVVLEQELVRAEAESLVAEAQLSNITREKLKAAFTYQFDALREHSEKMAIVAGFGKHLLELVDDSPVTPGETRNAYDGYEASKAIIQDCEDALTNWVEQNAAVSSKLSTRARTLSQRRRNQTSGHDLSGQDQDRESGMWIPASQHAGQEYDDEEDASVRGREEERAVA